MSIIRQLLFVIPTLLLATSMTVQGFTDPIHRTGMEVYTCPNGIIEDTEQCDDNNAMAGDMCAPNCRLFNCGDTVLDTPYEECDDGNTTSGDGCDGRFCFIEYGLYFSEYLEGSSNNKALEIKNPSPDPYDMNANNCYVLRYNNGSPTPTDALALGANVPNHPVAAATFVFTGSSIIAPDDVFTMGNPTAVAAILNVSDHLGTIAFFNGDDALALECGGTLIDIIGVIGQDPGVNWPVDVGGATSEFTLVRRCRARGETNWVVSSSAQWEVHPQNTFTFLDSGSCNP